MLLAGLDPTGYGGVIAGFGDQREVELLVEAGFTPVEAIHIATSNGARISRRTGQNRHACGRQSRRHCRAAGRPVGQHQGHRESGTRLQGRRRLRLRQADRLSKRNGRPALRRQKQRNERYALRRPAGATTKARVFFRQRSAKPIPLRAPALAQHRAYQSCQAICPRERRAQPKRTTHANPADPAYAP